MLVVATPVDAQQSDASETDSAPISMRLDATDNPWIYQFHVESHAEQEVAIDRRLLEFSVQPEDSRRRFRCRHPDQPRRGETRSMTPGQIYSEWLDLREYCSGNALTALRRHNATINTRFGYSRGGRSRFVARREGRRPTLRIDGPSLAWENTPQEPTDAPIRLSVSDQRSRGQVRFITTIRAGVSERPIVYLRDDLLRFVVRTPSGQEVHCVRPRQEIYPIRERFRRLGRRMRRNVLAANHYCPADTFDEPGVYEVTPILTLPYGAEGFPFEALTGRFRGSPGVIHVRSRRYHRQPIEDTSTLKGAPERRGSRRQ